MQLPSLRNAKIEGKNVFLRLDLDIPIVNGKVENDFRLLSSMPTIEYLLKRNAKIIIGGHLGRPKGKDESLSLEPIAKWLDLRFKINDLRSGKRGEFEGWEIGSNIFILENLRFFKEEEANSSQFAKKLASLADIYVNEAFADSHRNHASITEIPKYLPHFAGFHLEEEAKALSGILKDPKRPFIVIIGGAKIETKLPLIEKMHKFADYILVGGKLAEEVKTLLRLQHEKINLPSGNKKSVLLTADLNDEGTDITPKSIENFLQILNLAKTVVWNGPMGKISDSKTAIVKSEEGSKKLAEGLVKSSAYTVVGGGDTVGFLEKACLLDNFACMSKTRCFLSTGGGAMLSFLSGEKLPGLEILS